MSSRFVVVGGDAAGMSAASKAKRDAPEMEVVVFERTDWASYGACGIPYYVEGVIHHLDDLVVVGQDDVEQRGIDLRREHDVTSVDPDSNTVTVDDGNRRTDVSYDSLLLATGGRAIMPDCSGIDARGVFGIRNPEAGRALRDYITQHRTPLSEVGESDSKVHSYVSEVEPTSAAVIGANKIGIEFAESFATRGLSVSVIEHADHILPLFGPDAAGIADTHLREEGIDVRPGTTIERLLTDNGRVTAIETSDGTVEADIVLVDVGVEPSVHLTTDTHIELGATGAIATDRFGRTSVPDVYAAGDCAEKHHLLANENVLWPFALAANRGGRAVGSTVAGERTPVGGVVGTLVMKAFDVELARTGLLEEEAQAAGYTPVSTTISTITRAHYYPGWSRIVVHAVADYDSGRLLGATLAGREGAAHRINSVATAIQSGLTLREVGALDFGYAPPFGPVWDPVLTAVKVLTDKVA